MDKSLKKYYIVQKLKYGKWINDTAQFYGLTSALRCYSYFREITPCEKYRIAKGRWKLPDATQQRRKVK